MDAIGPDDIRGYQAYLLGERKLAVDTVVVNVCALRFLYIKVLKRRDMKEDLLISLISEIREAEMRSESGDDGGSGRFAPHAVPPKISFPLLEGVSLEENEDLHTMWSALPANASSPDRSNDLRPGYINPLRQLKVVYGRLCNDTDVTAVVVCLSSLEATFLLLDAAIFLPPGSARRRTRQGAGDPSTMTPTVLQIWILWRNSVVRAVKLPHITKRIDEC